MKTEISRDSLQKQKRYSGVYQQQGRMLTDSDWNELVDILKLNINNALRDVVGNHSTGASLGGTPRHRPLAVINSPSDTFSIQPGHVYADGTAAWLPGDVAIAYSEQPDFPSAPVPAGSYRLYVDVWERTVTQLLDEHLRDKGLHGADTCSRQQTMAQIKFCPSGINPEDVSLNPRKGNGLLSLKLLQKATDVDICDPCAAVINVESNVGNYLFRVEVHDVQGNADNPTQITLKWSSENGAEQFEALSQLEDMPAGFISDKWIYEFFDETTERHLGVHLDNTGWNPSRGVISQIKPPASPYHVPVIPNSAESTQLVRRWDGYCVIDLTTNSLVEGVDRGVTLSTSKTPGSLGYVEIGSALGIILESIKLDLALTGHQFVAGDFWITDVRDAVHDPLNSAKSILLEQQEPSGIQHSYLALAEVNADVLQANPEADRKFAFPSLSEMTRLYIAGGDGQEIVPSQPLPQPIKVGVANGEWPVQKAKVRFEIESGGGSISVVNGGLTDSNGIAECVWTPDAIPGALCRVRASLVNPAHPADTSKDLRPPVYFYANLISADQVSYTPACADSGENTVHSHLATDPGVSLDLGSDAYYTVKEVLDALICSLQAKHIPFNAASADGRWQDINEGASRPETVQQAIDDLAENLDSTDIRYLVKNCGTAASPSVRMGLSLSPGITKVDQVLDRLLCQLNATHLPVDRDDLCSKLKALSGADRVKTVQDAINALCQSSSGGGCAVSVGDGGQFDTLEKAFEALNSEAHICICLMAGKHILEKAVELKEHASIKITGCGPQASVIYITESLTVNAHEIVFRDLGIAGNKPEKDLTGIGQLTLKGSEAGCTCVVDNCRFTREFEGTDTEWQPLVNVSGNVDVDWHSSTMNASRVFPEVKRAVLPKRSGLTGKPLALYNDLQSVLDANLYNKHSDFEARVDKVFESAMAMNRTERKVFFEARSTSHIDKLPNRNVKLNLARRSTSTESGRRAVRSVNPRKEVGSLYQDIFKATDDSRPQLLERLTIAAALVHRVDDALAFGSSLVEGNVHDNVINGNLVLFSEQDESTPLDWFLPDGVLPENKYRWTKSNDYLSTQGELSIHDNKLTAVKSLVSERALKELQDIFRGADIESLVFNGYQHISVHGNTFIGHNSSFIAGQMRITSNQFKADDDGDVVAYLMAYELVLTSNICDQSAMFDVASRQVAQAANLANIV